MLGDRGAFGVNAPLTSRGGRRWLQRDNLRSLTHIAYDSPDWETCRATVDAGLGEYLAGQHPCTRSCVVCRQL